MPQSTDKQRDLMCKWFGDRIDDGPPTAFLLSHGYTCKHGFWFKPTPGHTISREEGACIDFLCDEWDYGFSPPQEAER